MQTFVTPATSFHPFFPILQSCKTTTDVKRAHALSLRVGSWFNHPSISARILTLYGSSSINHLHYAAQVFSLLPFEPDLFSWNVLIKCHVDNGRSHDALSLFRDLMMINREENDDGLDFLLPDEFTFPSAVKACARLGAARAEGRQIHAMALKLGFGSHRFVQSSLVSMYSRCGEIVLARNVFDQMPERDRDLVLWNCLVDGYARCGEIELALKLFGEMPERDLFAWTCLVDGFCKRGLVEKAREIFDCMPSRGLISWNAMIDGYMKSGNFECARELFEEMSEERDVITWNSMIAGYASNKKFSEALSFFAKMLREYRSSFPNNTTFVGALSASAGLAVLGVGKSVHTLLVKSGIEPEGVIGTSLIDMYSKCGSIESALRVFDLIPTKKKKLGHYTAAIVGLGSHGMVNRAAELFYEMLRANLKPHSITFLGLLSACSHSGSVDLGRSFFDAMRLEFDIEPSIEHYGCLVDMLCRARKLEEAMGVVENMPTKPNKVIWMSLLSGARIHGNLEIGELAARKLVEVSPETIGSYVTLSNMYASAGKWEKVVSVRETIKKLGIRKEPGRSYVEHQGLLHEFVVGDRSHPRTEEIYAKMKEMREKLKSAGHVPDTTQVLLCLEDEAKKEAELESHSERLSIAFGLISAKSRSPIRVLKNLRVCSDCHSVTKLLSKIYGREIIVRDNSRFHHFKDGLCSCKDFW